MKLYFIPLIDLLCIFNVKCLQGTNNSLSFSKDASIVGKTCPDYKAFTAQNIHSMFVCATMCHQDEMCASFFFSSSAGRCDGCKLVYNDALALIEEMEGSMYYKRAVKWTCEYMGCVAIASIGLAYMGNANNMTIDWCADRCQQTSYIFQYCGIAAATSCMCSYDVLGFSSENKCNMRCGGNPYQICGGIGYFSVYSYIDDE